MSVPVADDLIPPAGGRATCEAPLTLLRRHLGLPAEAEWDDAMSSRAAAASEWYSKHGTPWTLRRGARISEIGDASIELEAGARLSSRLLADGLRDAAAHTLVVAAISAGPEVEREIERLWKVGRPDEAMFLSAWAISVVEHFALRWHPSSRRVE